MIKPPPSVTFVGTFGLTLLAIAGLFIADTFLAKADKAENDIEAVRLFKEGQMLLAQGKDTQAIDRLTDAIEIDRTNRMYMRTLARAQLAAGDLTQAQATLTKLLESDSADGQSSLLMAHLMTKEGHNSQAVSYFHRATYAHWSEDEEANRRRARSELINLLAAQNSKEELLAELLAFQEQAPKDIKARLRMGDLFLQAGSPSRATDVFHQILRDQPGNVDAYKGLAEADLAKTNYRSAQREFELALRLAPTDAAIKERLALCNQILQLDPTQRGLNAEERYRRSKAILQMTLDDANQCLAQPAAPETQELLDKTNGALKAAIPGAQQSEASEANIDLAEQLWQLRKKECKSAPNQNGALALVLARQTQ